MTATNEKHSPLEQFEIIPYLQFKTVHLDLSFTNSSLTMVLTVALITIFFTATVNTRSLIPTRMQMISEMSYNFIAKLLEDTVGNEGRKYFPFVFAIFMFVQDNCLFNLMRQFGHTTFTSNHLCPSVFQLFTPQNKLV